MKQVLVTGGRGFIGSYLVNYLKSLGYWIRSVDVKVDCYPPTEEDEFILLDLRKPENAYDAVEGMDYVYHLAANVGGIGYIMATHTPIMRDNVRINVNMLEACRSENVERFFFSSSACIYPVKLQEEPDAPPLKENVTFGSPDSAYGWEKLFMEQLCKYYYEDYNLPVRIARFHNIYGPHIRELERRKAPLNLCIKTVKAQNGGVIDVWGDGLQRRSFLHISDCVEAIHLLTLSDYCEPMNVGTDRSVSIDDLAELIIGFSGKTLWIKHDLSKPQGVRGRNADLTLITEKLGWKPKVSLEDGMRSMYKFVESLEGR